MQHAGQQPHEHAVGVCLVGCSSSQRFEAPTVVFLHHSKYNYVRTGLPMNHRCSHGWNPPSLNQCVVLRECTYVRTQDMKSQHCVSYVFQHCVSYVFQHCVSYVFIALRELRVPALRELRVPALRELRVPALCELRVPALRELRVPALRELRVHCTA